jgi:hypothetical protein
MAINPNKKKKVKKLPVTTKIGQYDDANRAQDVMPTQTTTKKAKDILPDSRKRSYNKGGLIQHD